MVQKTLSINDIRNYKAYDGEVERCLHLIADRIEKGEKLVVKEKTKANGNTCIVIYGYDKTFNRYNAVEVIHLNV